MRKTCSPREMVALLTRSGFVQKRQRGSHALFVHADGRVTTVPMHGSEMPKGTMHAILKQTWLTLDSFDI